MYAVIHADSGKEISYHETVAEAIEMIGIYECGDRRENDYEPDRYDWKPVAEYEKQN